MKADIMDDCDTGPFCVHFGEPGACDEPCGRCGHPCKAHPHGNYCNVEGCECDSIIGEPILYQ